MIRGADEAHSRKYNIPKVALVGVISWIMFWGLLWPEIHCLFAFPVLAISHEGEKTTTTLWLDQHVEEHTISKRRFSTFAHIIDERFFEKQ